MGLVRKRGMLLGDEMTTQENSHYKLWDTNCLKHVFREIQNSYISIRSNIAIPKGTYKWITPWISNSLILLTRSFETYESIINKSIISGTIKSNANAFTRGRQDDAHFFMCGRLGLVPPFFCNLLRWIHKWVLWSNIYALIEQMFVFVTSLIDLPVSSVGEE